MSARSLTGLVVLCAAALLVAMPRFRDGGPGGEAADERVLAAYAAAGVRVSLPGLDDPDAGSAPRGLAFGPAPPLAASSDPLSRAVQALTDGRYDRAIGLLERALESDPDDSDLNAALSAGYLARGFEARDGAEPARPADLVEALDRIGPDPTDLPSLFNRGLALEALYCYRMAARTWERYLELDPGSDWGALAVERLEGVREVIAELDRASEEPAEIDRVDGDPRTDSAHAAALTDLRDGLAALGAMDVEVALRRLEDALPPLAAAGDPRAWRAELGIAETEYHLQRLDRSEPRARRVLAEARRSGDVALEARALWLLANLNIGRLDLQEALRFARERHDLGRRSGDSVIVATAGLTLSRVLDELGDPESGWRYRVESFRSLAGRRDARLAVTIGNSSFALARQGLFRAAEDFASEMLLADRVAGKALDLVDGLWTRASHRAGAGDADGSLADVSEAEGHLAGIEDSNLRARYRAGLEAVRGSVLRTVEPARAVESLTSALDRSRRLGYEYGRSELLLERARALRRLGRPREAARDLADATRAVSSQRGRIAGPLLRVSFFDLQAELADEAVEVAVELGSGEQAFRIAESAKGILLRESLGLTDDSAADGGDDGWRAGLSSGDALIAFWSLPDELLIWTLRAGGEPHLHRAPISRSELVEWVGGLEAAISLRGLAAPELERGYALLLAPLDDALAGVRRLVVVPDRFTRGVPWTALRDGETGESVLARFVVRLRPSTFGIDGAPSTIRHQSGSPFLVALADARSDDRLRPGLPEARREVGEVAAHFERSTVLVGRDATPRSFLEALSKASIVHVATHFEGGVTPWSTWIPLAPEEDGSGRGLAVRDIARLDLSRVRLAVLSGCATQREGKVSLEGTFSAAGAFLAAGSHEVIGTLWPVDDRAAAELMTELYPRVLRGMETDEALREAQLAMVERGDATLAMDWAAFQVVSMRPSGVASGG